jgi:hypothetical protein
MRIRDVNERQIKYAAAVREQIQASVHGVFPESCSTVSEEKV